MDMDQIGKDIATLMASCLARLIQLGVDEETAQFMALQAGKTYLQLMAQLIIVAALAQEGEDPDGRSDTLFGYQFPGSVATQESGDVE